VANRFPGLLSTAVRTPPGPSPMAPLGETFGQETSLISGANPIPHPRTTRLPAHFGADWYDRPTPQTPGKTQGTGSRVASQTTTTLQSRSKRPQEGLLAPVLARL